MGVYHIWTAYRNGWKLLKQDQIDNGCLHLADFTLDSFNLSNFSWFEVYTSTHDISSNLIQRYSCPFSNSLNKPLCFISNQWSKYQNNGITKRLKEVRVSIKVGVRNVKSIPSFHHSHRVSYYSPGGETVTNKDIHSL